MPLFFSSTVFLALVSCFLWSTAFAAIKIGLPYTTPLQFAGIRFMLSGVMILPFIKNRRTEFGRIKSHISWALLISLFQTVLLYIFFYEGIARTPGAVAAVVVGGGPLFVALMAHFITGKDKMTLRKSVALLVGFSGIVLLALVKDHRIDNDASVVIGIALLVVGNVSGSLGNILVSQNRRGISPVALSAFQLFIGGAVILVISFFVEGVHFGAKPLPYYLSLLWLGFLSAAAFTIWFMVLSRPQVRVSEINVWKFIIPVIGAVLSWLLIPGEGPAWRTVAGMVLIALAIILIYGSRWFKTSKISTFGE